MFAATFYLSELVLSPIFGILSDRIGHHRVMLYGPVFGAVAVILTGLAVLTVPVLGLTRLLEGASTAASVPSILGFIALATAGNEVLRGKAAARFEGATLAGLGVGFIVAPTLFEAFGHERVLPQRAGLRRLVPHLLAAASRIRPARRRPSRRPTSGSTATSRLVRSSHVLLLAPTWIALNASIGLWFSQSLFQFSQENPRFPDQFLMSGFSTVADHRAPRSPSRSCSGPACCTGATGSRRCAERRSSCSGSSAAASSSWPGFVVNHAERARSSSCPIAAIVVAAAVCS